MLLKDNVNVRGVFSIKSINVKDEVIDEYKENNLIMDNARANMAQLIGGVNTGASEAKQIDGFVMGTRGHMGSDVLDFQQVGETDTSKPTGNQTFQSTRTNLFSESIDDQINYRIPFDASGDVDVTLTPAGTRYEDSVSVGVAESSNILRRVVSDRTVTYTITIPASNANSGIPASPVVVYTEAALYAGTDIFAMKTFPARVKEDTVKFEITWSIIF
jgi:hypothetical protein